MVGEFPDAAIERGTSGDIHGGVDIPAVDRPLFRQPPPNRRASTTGARPMTRLGKAALPSLPADVARPHYDLDAVQVGVVHLGVGAFHRAHQAVYLDDRLAAGETGWAIHGASLRSPETQKALEPQDGLYALALRGPGREDLRVVGSLRALDVAPLDPERLIAAMSDPKVRVVSLTVTEKGYCHDPASCELVESHPDIVHDLARPAAPRSAPGFIVEALRRRRASGVGPFTVLSCDNLPSNGATASRVLTRFAGLRDAELGKWFADHVACPSTMVDRIVPATTDDDRARIAARLGCADAWPVVTEPFSQWVIEDHFPAGRPRLEDSGGTLVADVAPYELAKLRLLNGSHSTLAYLGYLAGYDAVSDAMADAAFARLASELMDEEVTPTLRQHGVGDVTDYKRRLLERFANPALRHRTWQIAMDGSQKLPQRLLGTVRDRLAVGAPIARLALAVAAWMRYVAGVDELGRAIDVRDPLAAQLNAIADSVGPDPRRLASAFVSLREVFADDLAADPRFLESVAQALAALYANGARRTVEQLARL
jgi:fructuronate reductase